MKALFKFPNTRFCLVVWYRPRKGQKKPIAHETRIETPVTHDKLQTEMLKHRVGYSEIRAVKADPNSPLRDTGELSADGLRSALASNTFARRCEQFA